MYVQRLISFKELNEKVNSASTKTANLSECTKSKKSLLLKERPNKSYRLCSVCTSLSVKINLHKARVKNSQLRLFFWLQSGANMELTQKETLKFKLTSKKFDNSEFDKEV
jgi:hypothetical protein